MVLKRFCDYTGAEIETSHPTFEKETEIAGTPTWFQVECVVRKKIDTNNYEEVEVSKTWLKNLIAGA